MSTTLSRRSFLKATEAIAAVAAASRLEAERLQLPIGLQLYSVRNLLPKDFDGTLAQVRSAGYTVVEAAGYFDRSAKDFRHAMDTAGLRCVSTHHPLNVLETQLDQWLDYGHTIGLEYMVCSWSGGVHRDPAAKGPTTLDDWRWIAGEFNRIGEKTKSAGITLGVHNHTPEFAVIDGVLVYDELLRLTDPKLVAFEMDCGWVYASGMAKDDSAQYASAPDRAGLRLVMMRHLFLAFAVCICTACTAAAQTPDAQPVNPDETPAARVLLHDLDKITGHATISGEHNYPNTVSRYSDRVYDLTGEYPGIFGQDFGFSGAGR
jgi:hypothetical protein